MLGDAESWVAKAMARGADQADVFLSQGANIDVDVESGRLAGTSRSQSFGGNVRVIKDNRVGFAYFTKPDQVDDAIARALQQSRLAPELPFDLPDAEPVAPVADAWDDEVAELDPAAAIESARNLIAAVDLDATIAGGVGLSWGMEALANHNGVAVADRATMMQAYTSLVLADGATNVNAWDTRSRPSFFDVAPLAAGVAQTVRDLRSPKEAKSGKADVILRPDAGGELVAGLMEDAVHGDSAMRGKSFWSDKLGEQVAHDGVQLLDAPRHEQALAPVAFDGEGRPTQDRAIVASGCLKTFLFDTRDGAKHQQAPTANALREGFKTTPSTGAHHLVLEHDTTCSLDALIGGIDHGYLVDSVLGAHTANGTTGDFSVTAPNVWRIEGGSLAGACKEIAIGGNLPSLLAGLDGVSDQPKRSNGSRMPAVRLRDVHVST